MPKPGFTRLAAAAAAAVLALSITSCGSTGQAPNEDGSFSGILPIYTPRQGGSAYVLGGGIANQVSRTVDGVQATVEATTGTQEMIQRLSEKQAQGQPAFALPDTTGAARAVEGREPFENPHPDLRALSTVQEGVIYMVARADSGLDSLDDLKGKSIGLGVGGSVVNYLTKEVLEAHGVEEGSYQEQPLGYQEVADGLANGSLDAGVIAGAAPVSSLTELAAQHDVTIIGTDPQIMDDLMERAPYVLDTAVEPGMYQGIDNETNTFSFSVAVVTHKDTPDDTVQSMMQLLFEQTDELAKVHASAKGITLDNATKGIAFDFHPAAAEYLEEKGVDVP